MAWTDFYMQTTGSNLNAGSTTSDNAAHTYASGSLATVTTTATFTVASGNPQSDGVAVGDWVSIYPDGNTTTPFISKVTSVTTTTIVCSSTANSFGTVPTNGSSNRTLKHGGAWADLGMLASGVALNTGTVPVSMRVNVKAGTYANTATTRTFALAGSTTVPIWWRGYKTTPGDQDSNNVAVAGTDIPAITFTTGQMAVSGAYHIFSSLDINSAATAATGAINITATTTFYRFRSTNTAANANSSAISPAAQVHFTSCYFSATTTATACVSVPVAAGQRVFVGTIVSGGQIGINSVTAGIISTNFCVFYGQTSDAIKVVASLNAINCSFYAPGGNGINLATATNGSVSNCYFENVNQASKSGIRNTSGTNTGDYMLVANSYFNCTTNTFGFAEDLEIFSNGTLASTGFVNPGSLNFAVNPIGRALSYPGGFETTNVYTGYLDMGAVQRREPPGPVYSSSLSGGMIG